MSKLDLPTTVWFVPHLDEVPYQANDEVDKLSQSLPTGLLRAYHSTTP